MSIKALRGRWSDRDLVSRGWSLLRGQGGDVGLPPVSGRVDLRGIPAPPAQVPEEPWRPPWVEDAAWSGLDLSHAQFAQARLVRVDATDCVLDGIDLTKARVSGGTWSDCRLVGAKMGEARMSAGLEGGPGFRAERCDLTKADLRQATFIATELTQVSLAAAKVQKALFTESALTDIDLDRADLRQTEFGSRFHELPAGGVAARLTRVDFSSARLEWTEFRASVLEACRFPAGTCLIPHLPSAVRLALAELPVDFEGRAEFERVGGLSVREDWADDTVGVILDPSPFHGSESIDGLLLRAFRAVGADIVEA